MAQEADMRRQLDGPRDDVADVQASRRRLALAADAERRSIERALHDDIQQQLVGLAANLELAVVAVDADPAATKTRLAEMRRDVQQAIEDARNLADRIYPPLLDAGGFAPALRAAAARAHVPTRLDVETGRSYPPEIAGLVYFTCLEVLEHAGAGTAVAVTLRSDEATVTFEVVVEGAIDAEGLFLRDRVEALDGRLDVRSEPDHRTRLVGSVPLSG
jgi:signal transduction histidine kinase